MRFPREDAAMETIIVEDTKAKEDIVLFLIGRSSKSRLTTTDLER